MILWGQQNAWHIVSTQGIQGLHTTHTRAHTHTHTLSTTIPVPGASTSGQKTKDQPSTLPSPRFSVVSSHSVHPLPPAPLHGFEPLLPNQLGRHLGLGCQPALDPHGPFLGHESRTKGSSSRRSGQRSKSTSCVCLLPPTVGPQIQQKIFISLSRLMVIGWVDAHQSP